MNKRTPLYQEHCAAGATFTAFFGWEMPLHYGSQVDEHHVVRQAAGMFDVSHMTIVDLLGAGGRQLLRHILANDIDKLKHPGSALYSCMLNHEGGVIDDLIVYFRAADNYRIVLNAATKQRALSWLGEQANGASVGLQERSDYAMIAVQGPQAREKIFSVLTPKQLDAVSTLQPFEAVDVDNWFFARTGYTGEDGLEITIPIEYAAKFWQALLAAGVRPCGLGARDTLRLESGLMLSGQDMDETVTPYQAALGWTVAMTPKERDFIGRAALDRQLKQGLANHIVGLVLEQRGVMRHGQVVKFSDQSSGIITSGSYSPTLQRSIALARVPVNNGGNCMVMIRDKAIPARVIKPRFLRAGKSLID